jgi:gamma-glutamyltranspeptidase/glutathione hydrolase
VTVLPVYDQDSVPHNRKFFARLLAMTLRYDRRSFLAITGGTIAGAAATRALGAVSPSNSQGIVIGYPAATGAGAEILAAGGNAIDAVVASALAAGVVALPSCGIGGYGGHLIIGTAAGKLSAIDFNSTAPAAARPDMFQVDVKGIVKDKANSEGWLAAGVPGTLAGLQLALNKFGSMKFPQVVQPAIRIARVGFNSPLSFRVWFDPAAASRKLDPASVKLFVPDGKVLNKGDKFRNPQLADMLQQLADSGSVEPFYRGEIARQIARQFKQNGGIVTEDDFANYHALEQTPYQRDYLGCTIATAPLTAGGLTVLQVFAALDALDWQKMPETSPTKFQAMVEALRIAWGDRLRLFGDPKFVDVPVERLLSDKYAKESARKIKKAISEKRPVPVITDGRTAGGTVNLSAADAKGNMAVITLTHGDSFGARVTVDGLGLLLGHGMSRFEPVPGKLNSIAPGKRPLDNMCPSLVLKGGRPVVALGGVGGRRIPNGVFQTLLQFLAERRSLNDSVQAPRIHTEGGLELRVERGIPKADVDHMRQIGYSIAPPIGAFVSAVQYNVGKDGRPIIVAAADRQPELTVLPSVRENSLP